MRVDHGLGMDQESQAGDLAEQLWPEMWPGPVPGTDQSLQGSWGAASGSRALLAGAETLDRLKEKR